MLPVFGQENYEYLYLSAVNYAKLVGGSLLPTKDYSVPNLFLYMKGLLKKRQNMTLIEDRDIGEIGFYLYFDTDFLYD
ncbi:MAG: hypothetical protein LIP01_10540, partial [Tannerellaceae bacterium]|nr:hypothetical protein [Tannerellaceae bacterium]